MRYLLLLSCMLMALLSSSCQAVHSLSAPKTPAAQAAADASQLASFAADHPGLFTVDTIPLATPYQVPEVKIKKVFVLRRDTIYLQAESTHLDSLINNLSASLDTAQQVATRAKMRQLLRNRPVLRDTLAFDTLGVSGRVWREGRKYQLRLTRAAISGLAAGQLIKPALRPCPPLPQPAPFALLNPATYGLPFWLWLLLGFLAGFSLGCFFCIKLTDRTR